MKYSKSNPPLVCMMTQSTCYKGTRTMNVLGVLWHSTGANNPNLRRYVQPDDKASDRAALLAKLGTNNNRNDWNHVSVQAGLNAWVGKLADGTVTSVQTMPWNYRPWGCGSGSKGSCNSGWIQFEICEDGLTDKTYFEAAYKEAAELTAYLCQLYNIDPHGTVNLNGVKVPTILCHADSHKLGLGSNHGDVLHWFPKFGKNMDTVRQDVAALLGSGSTPAPAPTPSTGGKTKIMGTAVATAAQMQAYIKGVNPSVAQSVIDMIPLYLSEGAVEGVRGDIAFAQSCLETGNFGFKGSAVTLDQNNFCGMGVTSNGVKGNSFATPQLGIRAQIQHLKAYASKDALKNATVDPRFQYVTRGCAEYVEWLGQQENPAGKGWASGAGYGASILAILKKVVATSAPASKTTMYRVRKTWADAASQIGAYTLLDNAKRSADAHPGYSVFDESGNAIYPVAAFTPYQVRVSISDLYIRSEPSKGSASRGFIAPGVYTVVEEQSGAGSTAGWGKLKSGAGWISLDYCKKI